MIDTTSEGMGTENQGDERHPVRKILKTLPKVHARHDFEFRLRKRITGEERPATPSGDRMMVSRHVPAYALSLVALLSAGVVAYFSLIRSSADQVEQPLKQDEMKQETPQQQSSPAQPPSIKPGSRTAEVKKLPEVQPEETLSTRFSIESPSSSVPSRKSVQDQMRERGMFREVGGTGMRSDQPAETAATPFIRAVPNAALQLLHDSIAHADSAQKDSLLKLLQEDSRKSPDQ